MEAAVVGGSALALRADRRVNRKPVLSPSAPTTMLALARGESRFQVPGITDHMQTGAWLASEFLGAEVRFQDHLMVIRGADFRPGR